MISVQKPIVFVDTVCPKSYSPQSLIAGGLGGTEATVLRIAERLGEVHTTWVMQHNRTGTDTQHKAVYKPLKAYLLERSFKAQAFIVLRQPEVAINLKKRHPDTPVWLWLHDLVTPALNAFAESLTDLGVGVIVVSDFHKTNLVTVLQQNTRAVKWPSIQRVYNPIDDSLHPHFSQPIDKNKLVFFSSPHKGLDYTLKAFEAARRINPNFKLFISNPGYLRAQMPEKEGVVDLGVLPHAAALEEVRTSLCVFYPNHVFPETFGLVFAEANAVGTPVLTHPMGAASEVLSDRRQLVDTKDLPSLIGRLMQWFDGNRPRVEGTPAFRLSTVIKTWYNLLRLEG